MPQPQLSPGFRLIYCPKCRAGFVAHASRILIIHGIPSIFCPGNHEVWLDRTEVREWTDANDLDPRADLSTAAAGQQWPVHAPNSRPYGEDLWQRTQRLTAVQRLLSWWKRWRASRQPQQRQAPP